MILGTCLIQMLFIRIKHFNPQQDYQFGGLKLKGANIKSAYLNSQYIFLVGKIKLLLIAEI
jgi:hypothetical protein